MSVSRSSTARLIGRVALAKDASFRELIALAKLDPRSDFRGSDLSGIDFGSIDVSGFDFTNADLTECNLTQVLGLRRAKLKGAKLDRALFPSPDLHQDAERRRRERHEQYLALKSDLTTALNEFAYGVIDSAEYHFDAGNLRILSLHHRGPRIFRDAPRGTERGIAIRPRILDIKIVVPRSITQKSISDISLRAQNREVIGVQLAYPGYEGPGFNLLCQGLLQPPLPRLIELTQDGGLPLAVTDRAWVVVSPWGTRFEPEEPFRYALKVSEPKGRAASALSEAAFKALNAAILAPRSNGRLSIDIAYGKYESRR